MNKVVKYHDFYRKIYYLKLLSIFKISISVNYKNKNYSSSLDKHSDNIDTMLKILDILNAHQRKNKYELIYDYACDYLDSEFMNNNWCDFKKNMCISNRNKPIEYRVGSCCTSNISKKTCNHFDNDKKRCGIKCLSCKLFVCPYLESKGIKYRINDVPYLKYFLSLRQKLFIKVSFFKTKEETIENWLKFYKLPELK